jgi:hypothetical protein
MGISILSEGDIIPSLPLKFNAEGYLVSKGVLMKETRRVYNSSFFQPFEYRGTNHHFSIIQYENEEEGWHYVESLGEIVCVTNDFGAATNAYLAVFKTMKQLPFHQVMKPTEESS